MRERTYSYILPVFTCSNVIDIRLQLLEPDRYPYLFKCLYGLLMLLPQSSAFISLRNRLNAVNSAGFLHIAPKPSALLSLSSQQNLDTIAEVRLRRSRRDRNSHVTRSSGRNSLPTFVPYRHGTNGRVVQHSVMHLTSAPHSRAPHFQSVLLRGGARPE